MLAEAARDRNAAMHTITVATVAQRSLPQVRTVVLRAADGATRQLRFHTDLRSPKIAELAASHAVQVLAYDPGQKVQLRLSGSATIHHGDTVWQSAWQAAHRQSRLCYGQTDAPGTTLSDPLTQPLDDSCKQNFAVVSVTVSAMDWLYLAAAGHRRARFKWSDSDGGVLTSAWIAP